MWFKIVVIVILIGGFIMPHGQPDFGAYAQKKTVYGLSDMGELAARLGSVVTYDRRGDVVWIEKFNNGMTNWTGAGAAGFVADESALESLSEGVSLRTIAPNAGAFDVSVNRRDGLPVNSRLGLEFAFLPDANADDIILLFTIHDGTVRHYSRIRIRLDDGIIDYVNDGTGFKQFVAGVDIKYDGLTWHHVKLVVDYSTSEYVRLLIDNIEYSMAGLGIWDFGVVTAPYLSTTLHQQYAGGVALATVYFDNVILTQNEP